MNAFDTQPARGASGWRVRIIDLSGGAEDSIVEEVAGFRSDAHATAFAQRYVRDSVERCRAAGMAERDVLDAWFAYGEDAQVLDANGEGWRSAASLASFAREPAGYQARNWRAIDPRKLGDGAAEALDPDPSEHR